MATHRRSPVHVAGESARVVPTQQQPAGQRVPEQCAVGKATWRDQSPGKTRVVNLANWDLCDIGYELAHGFTRYAGWGYWTASADSSWVNERPWLQVSKAAEMQPADRALIGDLVEMADVVHLNEYHNLMGTDRLKPGKRVVIHHHGCQYRDNPAQFERQETEARYTRIVSTPDLLGYGSPDYRANLHWLPSPLNLEELDRNFGPWERERGERIVCGHGYTVASNKGTTDFLRIAQSMKRIQVACWHRVQRRVSQWYLSQCDLYFGTFMYGPGLATLEAMAMGIPALVGCSPDDLAWQLSALGLTRIRDLPWIYVTRDTLAHTLRDLCADPALRAHWGARGRAYVEQYHAVPAVVARAKAIYERTEPCRFVVQP